MGRDVGDAYAPTYVRDCMVAARAVRHTYIEGGGGGGEGGANTFKLVPSLSCLCIVCKHAGRACTHAHAMCPSIKHVVQTDSCKR